MPSSSTTSIWSLSALPIPSTGAVSTIGMRLAAGMLSQLKLAPDTALAEVLGVSRETMRRNRTLLDEGGVEAVRSRTGGPRAPYKSRRLSEDEVDELLRQREGDIQRLKERRAALPKEVPLDQILDPEHIVQLERERKLLTDAFKMIAYRAESQLARWSEPFFKRHEEEVRKFLQSVFQATADLIPDARRGTLTVRFHGLSSPRATRALCGLCEVRQRDADLLSRH